MATADRLETVQVMYGVMIIHKDGVRVLACGPIAMIPYMATTWTAANQFRKELKGHLKDCKLRMVKLVVSIREQWEFKNGRAYRRSTRTA